ncbi:MAG: FtsW/RodA/SpoVE family cell cycle protein, partial [Syntrophobacterales bacterium]|nr:FtsW/RodA/SpoVE family cell cycle protein [Syntrophobacterales bacterium]
MKIDRRLLANFDWILLGLVLSICGIGILNLYSSGYNLYAGGEFLYVKQLFWVLLGLIMMGVAFSMDYRIIIRHAYLIYAVSIMLLLLVSFYGNMTHGSQRWLVLWGFSFQPSELMKLVIVIVLARYFNDNMEKGYNFGNLVVLLALLGMPFLLIVKQPDLG